MSEITRRDALKLASMTGFSLAGIGNAAASDDHGSGTTTETPDLSEDKPVHGIRLENSMAYEYGADLGVITPKQTQFVLANVYSGLPLHRLKLVVDGTRYTHGRVGGIGVSSMVATDAHEVETLAGFEVPRDLDASEAKLVVESDAGDDVLAEFDQDLLDALSKSATFEVESFDLPERAASTPKDMQLLVRNTGDRAGTFFGTVEQTSLSGPNKYMVKRIEPGAVEVVTTTRNYGPMPVDTSEDEFTFRADWGSGQTESSIVVTR